jgi:predicted Zn-dependent protease with MMP-like domain
MPSPKKAKRKRPPTDGLLGIKFAQGNPRITADKHMDFTSLCAMAEEEVTMIVKVLPDEVKALAEACPITYEDRPDREDGLEDDLLGLFEGASLIEEPGPDALPLIRIFVGNLWDYTERDEQDFRDEVGTTYLHELGHYLGWDEEEVAERGLE